MKLKKIVLAVLAISASLLFTAGCGKSPKFTEQEGMDYIRNVLNTKGKDYFKAHTVHSRTDVEKIKIISITGGELESHYYDTPARIYHVAYKLDSDSMKWDASIAVARDKSTGKMYMTPSYTGKNSARW